MTGREWRGSAFGGARGRTDVPKIVDWYMEGKINIDDLITHRLPLERINEGFDLMKRGVPGSRAALIASGALSGCATQVSQGGQAVPAARAISPIACSIARAEGFVGQQGDVIAERARDAAGANSVRTIRPGQQVTMDFRGDRLNLKLNAQGIVTGVSCG